MRCPKCGYISFDHLESCKKCNKQVSDYSSEINGTTYDMESPSFLQFVVTEEEDAFEEQPVEAIEEFIEEADGVIELADFDDGPEPSGEPSIELDEISLDIEDEVVEVVEDDDIVLNLDDLDDASPLEDFNIESSTDQDEQEINASPIDFGDLDISDLTPPDIDDKASDVEAAPAVEIVEEPVIEDESAVDAPPSVPEETISKKEGGQGLEDLLLDELDLGSTEQPVTVSSKIEPIQTGTALDNFNVDLGELFKEEDK